MSPRLAGKVALVTGAGSGIGAAIARRFAEEGATVVLADIEEASVRRVATEASALGGQAEAVALDVADESAWTHCTNGVVARHGTLNVLVNCAGISRARSLRDCSLDDWRKVLSINLDGAFLGIRAALAVMSRGSAIVNIASVSGIVPSGGAAAYCASKAALRMLTKTAAIESADGDWGVRINAVTPGGVKTPMWEQEPFFQDLMREHGTAEAAFGALAGDVASQQFASAEQVAETVLYLASDESAHLNGAEIVLDHGHSG